MYLKCLELTGFKSFAEARIEFPPGVTAVVGPNGVGKSNVVDSVLWVLGEQSTKTLRSERMEDVIFNGTATRKPLGMAEVTLIMSGMDARRVQGRPDLPNSLSEFHEVMITRRLYRNGDSEYLINKTPCRLKDIRSLFLDTRAGSKGHTIIEQGRIEQILNASPQERRELIEETAGIVRYKKQKAEALRKLEATQQNLLRVRDIIGEVRRQLNSLERQARQARTYRGLQEEARTIEIRLLVHEHRELTRRQTAVAGELAKLEAEEAERHAQSARLSTDLEAVRMKMLAGEQAIDRLRDALSDVEHQQSQAVTAAEVERGRQELFQQQRTQAQEELARLATGQAQAATETNAVRVRAAQLEQEIAAGDRALDEMEVALQVLSARRSGIAEGVEAARRAVVDLTVQQTTATNTSAALVQRREEALRRRERLRAERTELAGQQDAARARAAALAGERRASEGQVQTLREDRATAAQALEAGEAELRDAEQRLMRQQEDLAAIESSLRALRNVVREDMGYGREGEEPATSLRSTCAGVRSALAEWLEVPSGLDRAVEAALGERVRGWLVEHPADARRAMEFLKGKGLGRGAFVPLRARVAADSSRHAGASWWPAIQGVPGVIGRAVDLVRTPDESPKLLGWLLDGVVFVESLDAAFTVWEHGQWAAPAGPTLVTRDGEVLDAAGILTGGTSGGAGLLQRRREVERLEMQRGDLVQAVEDGRRQREDLLARVEAAERRIQALDEAIREAELRRLALTKDEDGCLQQADDLQRRLNVLDAEGRADDEERARCEEELAAAGRSLAVFEAEKVIKEQQFKEYARALEQVEEEGRVLQQRVTESRLAVTALRVQREQAGRDLDRLTKEYQQGMERVAELEAHVNGLITAQAQSQAERARHEALCRELDQRTGQIRAELAASQDVHMQDLGRSKELDEQLSGVRTALSALRDRRTTFEVQRAEINMQLAAVEGTFTGTYQLSVAEALAQVPAAADGPVEVEAEGEAAIQVEAEGETGSNGPNGQNGPNGPDEAGVDPIQALRDRLQKVRERLERMGAINLAAIEEHRELEERHTFLSEQEADLTNSITSLKEIISRINRTTKQLFLETFNELQEKFGEVFTRFFPGGRAELVLVEPEPVEGEAPKPTDEPGVDIVAQPPGKRLKSITMLSGGEKTLTAMALIFASFLIRPTPFCVLDEIDAPLDEENIGRFTTVLKELAERAQFIVITHNKRTMHIADSLIGVTMEEPGISKLVSVQLADLQPA